MLSKTMIKCQIKASFKLEIIPGSVRKETHCWLSLIQRFSFLRTGGLLLFGTAAAGLLGAVFTINENHRPFQASDYLHILIAAVHFFLLVTAMSAITTNLAFEGLLAQANLAHLFVTLAYDALFVFAICFLSPQSNGSRVLWRKYLWPVRWRGSSWSSFNFYERRLSTALKESISSPDA